jgi:HEAT repeat protein
MYARRQQVDKAIAQYRRAIAMNDRLFPAYFELAELLLARQEHAEADLLFRRVMRSANDDELIARAVRSSLQLNLSRGSVEELEKELLPLALANPDKPNYRKLLIELYSAITLPLINALHANPLPGAAAPSPEDEAAAERARAELARFGQRAVKPLLDALTDPQGSQQQLAIELLTRLHNEDASQALLVYAHSDAPTELRVRAMIAAGAPGHAALLPELTRLLFERGQPLVDEGDPVSVAAVWCLTQLQTARAEEPLARLLDSESPSAQMLSAVALGLRGVQGSRAALLRNAQSPEHTPAARGAALFALGALGAKEATAVARAALTDNDERVQALALVALARLDPEGALPHVAEALASSSEVLRHAALGAAGLLGGGSYRPRSKPLAIPAGRVEANEVLLALTPGEPTPDQRAAAIVRLEGELTRTLEAVAQRSAQDVRSLSSALLGEQGRPAFSPLSNNLAAATGTLRGQAEASLQRITSRATSTFVQLARHPSVAVRQAALQFLAHQTSDEAQRALLEALDDAQTEVRRQVLGALAERPFPAALGAVVARLERQRDWSIRVLALETLASFPKLSGPRSSTDEVALERIASLAQRDEVAFVREAALRALVALDPAGARGVLRKRAEEDTEPRVREFAVEALSRVTSGAGGGP